MKKVQFIIISTILSFGLIVSAALISNAIDKTNKLDNRITVKGVAEKRIKSDKALIKIIISNKNENLDNLKKEIDEKLLLIWEYEKPLFRYRFDILLTDFERKEKEIKTLIETHEKTINKQLKETKDIEEKYRELINEQKKYDKKILEIMGIFLSIFSVIGLGVSSLSKLKSNYFSTWSMICGTILITISGLFYLINFNEKVEKKTLKILIPGIIGLILIIIGVVCKKFLEI